MSRRSRKARLPVDPVRTTIESLSHDGKGVTHIEGKTIFIDGALPGEEIEFLYTSKRKSFDEGRVCEVITASEDRVEPRCRHAAICGGCSLQHMSAEAQIKAKHEILMDNLQRIGQVIPETQLEPLTGPVWGYRHKARMGARYVIKKEKMLVGFREKRSGFLAELDQCEVLHPAVGMKLRALADLISDLSIPMRMPQIEVAIGDDAVALIFRHLEALTEQDHASLMAFGQQHDMQIYLQPEGPDSIHLLYPDQAGLSYAIADEDILIQFQPTDFTQINPAINRDMIAQVIKMLDLNKDDRVLDLFCGLGNFTLPMARHAGHVVGVEGSLDLVKRARENAISNGIENAEFHLADLMADVNAESWLSGPYNKVLLDPPRSGAKEVIPQLVKLGVKRIVYVSCHPGSLARDAGMLVNDYGYRLVSAGVMDMFPHTAHVESIALFEL
ncbi:MAG: 23S rRNA (uracil(1939)-C(5))-methyltransferase RlmD [Gammaproteobacteria bacterium]|nr:23S rRNA (uracil(1939)-C(5))-methyltransferase RlmD [Gammaproteobacteria bacterium]